MATVQLELSTGQVIDLIAQLPPRAQRTVAQTLVTALGLDLAEEFEDLLDEDGEWEDWVIAAEEEDWDEYDHPAMGRRELLAAEVFAYSYANYDEHLGIGNARYEELMPNDVDTLAQAEAEGWDDARLAQALDVEIDKVEAWRIAYRRAAAIVDAPTPAESFRRGVRFSIQDAVDEGLNDEKALEVLVTQICYRAADLAYLLDVEGEFLSHYSKELRKSTPANLETLVQEFAQE